MHKIIHPKIMYFGTPVVIVSTLNENNTANLAPMSSAWWLANSCMLGMSTRSKTFENLTRSQELVINLPSSEMARYVNNLALLTGKNPVPEYKANMGYEYEPYKFETAGLTPVPSDLVKPYRVIECPVQLEGRVKMIHDFSKKDNFLSSVEVEVVRVHVDPRLIVDGTENHIDPRKWKPLLMNFCEFYSIGEQIYPSKLAKVFNPPKIRS